MLAADHPQVFVTDAEVLQELLHRYLALRLWAQGRQVFQRFGVLMQGRVEAIQAADVQRAAGLADSHGQLGGRDLLHAAVMQRLGIDGIVSADAGFDLLADVERLDPSGVDDWGRSLLGQRQGDTG